MKTDKIVAEAVRKFWEEHGYPVNVVCFFDQRYDYGKEWDHIRCIACPEASYDFDTVNFDWDFNEGQTDIKNIKIVTLEEVLDKFEEDN